MTADAVRLHRRQFVLGPEPVRARDDWTVAEVSPGLWLSHCPELRVARREAADGTQRLVLGLAVETAADRPPVSEQLAAASAAELARLSRTWAGRWLLLVDRRIHTDAGALLGCFYGRREGGAAFASSSPALISRAVRPGAPDQRRLVYEQGISWFPPPRSRFPGVARLLPSQVLDLAAARVEERPLVERAGLEPTDGDVVELLAESLVIAFQRLPLDGGQVWLSLSAGADSRAMLGAAHAAGIGLRTFTRVAKRVPVGDRRVPPLLARELGLEHRYVRGWKSVPRERAEIVDEHAAGHVSDGDAEPVLLGIRDSLEGISAGGECFPIVFPRLRVLGAPASVEGRAAMAGEICRAYGEPGDTGAAVDIAEWLSWEARTPHRSLDWRDRVCIEQHLAGWQSSKEQLYDLLRVERFFALNTARNYELITAASEQLRRGKGVQREVIRALAPQLLDYPINPRDEEFGAVRARLAKLRDDPAGVIRRRGRALRARFLVRR